MKVIGLIKILDDGAFESYRRQVASTVALYKGRVTFRGERSFMPWNELKVDSFDSFVEIIFPSREDAENWAKSPEYSALLSVRSKAMLLTLFGAEL